jgi:hypothetical protein
MINVKKLKIDKKLHSVSIGDVKLNIPKTNGDRQIISSYSNLGTEIYLYMKFHQDLNKKYSFTY